MRGCGQHFVVHSRVSSEKLDEAEFVGSQVFTANVRKDDMSLRESYADPVPARASLLASDSEVIPVGCTVVDGAMSWYIFAADQEGVVYLEPDAFYRAGEGASEHLRFWNPLLNKICRATFLGRERPQPRSPNPEPWNLEAGMENLTLARGLEGPSEEWVKLELKLGKDARKSLWFTPNDGKEVRTGWEQWEGTMPEDSPGPVFVYERTATGIRYLTENLPGEWVSPEWKGSSDRPIQFHDQTRKLFKTKRKKWFAGKNNTMYAYLEQGNAFIAWTLPLGDES